MVEFFFLNGYITISDTKTDTEIEINVRYLIYLKIFIYLILSSTHF